MQLVKTRLVEQNALYKDNILDFICFISTDNTVSIFYLF